MEDVIVSHHEYGKVKNLEEWIPILRTAVTLNLPDHSLSLNSLANALKCRYDEFGNFEDLEECISLHRDSLSLRHSGHPDRSVSLRNLANALQSRYDESGKVEDLEECIGFHRDTLSLRSPGHPDRSTCLNDLANGLQSRYDRFNEMEDLEDCMLFHREALSLRPPGHPGRSSSLNNLAIALMSRHARFGNIEDLEECILFHREALSLRPPGHRYRSASLNNLAIILMTQYEQFGKIKDLEECISFHRYALILRPPGHPHRSSSLNNLAIALTRRCDQFAEIYDLDECIALNRDALSLRPPGHPNHSTSLNNLASALMSRYNLSAKMEDLEECISLHREALSLRLPGHPGQSTSLNNLANALLSRYDRFDTTEDLEECILFYDEALVLRPLGHPDRSTALSNLANALMRRYNQHHRTEDLEDSISFHRNALTLHPPGHPHRSISLDSLATALLSRYDQFGKMEDLNDCISFRRDALNLCPPGHRAHPASLNNLANALGRRYFKFGEIEDLEDCLLFHRNTLVLRPPGHPDHSASLYNLASALINRYSYLGRIEDLQETFTCYEQAASDLTSYLNVRLRAALQWAHTARGHRHKSILDAYTAALDLLNRSLISRSRVESQHGFLATFNIPSLRSLASDAASAAIQDGNLELAVEFLEHGRAMLWSKVDAYKYPLEQLRQVHAGAKLADHLEMLSAELEHLVLLSDSAPKSQKESSIGEAAFDAQIKQHRIRSEEWESLVGKIREIDGFGSFLQAPAFNALQSAGAEGPVILVNVSRYRSDAIIPDSDNPPILVTLPSVRPDELNNQAKKHGSKREIVGVLRYLWDTIVSPVVDRLAELGVQKMSRIWWCPTAELCALPLHAAGPYGGGQRNLPDLYTSSYISTLSSLIRARSNIVQPLITPRLLVIGQPSETQRLERVEIEVNIVKELSSDKSVDVLFGPEANREAVLDGLMHHSWVHFACHGHRGENSQPFQASFELEDRRRLPLIDLIRARIPNAELAFLSACHSAEGDSRTPDENIHLSAALQFCGFRSVVGTLWEMDDEDGPTISEEFYRYMFREPAKIDFRDSAHALSSAIRSMRKARLPPERWVVFVHIGA